MANTQPRVKSLFNTYMAYFENTDLANELEKYILSIQSIGIESNVATKIKHNLEESKFDFFKRDEEVIKKSINYFAGCLKLLLNSLYKEASGYRVDFVDSWYHVGRKYSVHHVHKHPGCSWCGVFYVNPGDISSGNTVFLSPINSDFKDYGNKYLFDNEALAVQPKIGQLVMFPSYLQHFQSLYEGDESRIVIAFNCAVYRNR